ncbi:MAG: NAD(P)/FAD-dependent oxidoreductase [Proteobacteria bacterium]|nr:NAD(P)/FAD-dependent oxidoreductase [Pseudomonadota bacterium]MBU1717203.1 NAD(P)/FAD-dependent oxidoreductase [Pseudomonadota bacterium]
MKTIIVIGGGPAGLMAAGRAAQTGAETLLFEKMKRPGRKLCITGKGRCNITNTDEIRDFIAHFGKTGKFLRQVFTQFFNTELISFLEGLGLELVRERGGRVFPASGKASDVLSVLVQWVEQCGVQIRSTMAVDQLLINDGRIIGVLANHEKYMCDAVVLATGGASYPLTGSTGDGYRLVEAVGHKIVSIRPALVPLVTEGDVAGKLAELNLRNIKVRMLVDGKKHKEAFGEMVFAKFGVTGPVILTLSGDAVDVMAKGHEVELSVDLKPALDEQKLEARLLRDFASRGNEQLDSLLRGLLPREMVPVCLALTGIPPERIAHSVTTKERRRLRIWLKDFRLKVTGHRPFAEAIVTAGGIDTREIDPRTMESRLIKGLFLAGELIDVQAETGGYNLQAAFSTGWLAGYSAAQINYSSSK